eukprot:scaffold236406_cov35-Prasinocladus_malaysianus.AAC.1
MNWIGLDWIGLDWIGLDWIGLDWIGLDWIGLDWIGLDWTRREENTFGSDQKTDGMGWNGMECRAYLCVKDAFKGMRTAAPSCDT